jgi:hypothetical protein
VVADTVFTEFVVERLIYLSQSREDGDFVLGPVSLFWPIAIEIT